MFLTWAASASCPETITLCNSYYDFSSTEWSASLPVGKALDAYAVFSSFFWRCGVEVGVETSRIRWSKMAQQGQPGQYQTGNPQQQYQGAQPQFQGQPGMVLAGDR